VQRQASNFLTTVVDLVKGTYTGLYTASCNDSQRTHTQCTPLKKDKLMFMKLKFTFHLKTSE